jgi:hypothetical protein
MKTIVSILLLFFLTTETYAQSGVLWDRYYISGSLSVGQNNRDFADAKAWLQLGKDTTNKGLLMPRVLLDSINTTKRALFVYDLKDSVLYHFDGSKRVRYMTYKDTNFIKQYVLNGLTTDKIPEGDTNLYYKDSKARAAILAGAGISYSSTTGVITNSGVTSVDGAVGAVTLNGTYFQQGGNAFTTTGVLGTTSNFGLNLITNNTTKLSVLNSGKVALSGSTAEDVLTIGNDKASKMLLGIGRGGFASDNFPFIVFGTTTSDPSISAVNGGGTRMDINKIDALQLTAPNITSTVELRGSVATNNGGSVLGIGSRANGVGLGHYGTSGTVNWLVVPWHVGVNSDIKPTSGNMEFNILYISPRINQTGTANGPVRGIYINPQITNAPDFRALQIANTTGYGIYQTSTGVNNYFNGNMGIKTLMPTEALEVNGNIKTAQPSAAGAVKIGKVITGASVMVQTDKYLEVEIDGVIRKLAIVE